MEVRKEKTFPRGGRKPALFKSSNNSSFSFLRKPTAKAKQKKKNKRLNQSQKTKTIIKTTEELPDKGFNVKFVEDLKPTTIQDGMLVLGIVSKVLEKIVKVCLPGGLRGIIRLADVSEFYRDLIENSTGNLEVSSLEEIFQVGDVLPVKVLAVSEGHRSLLLTCDPKIINQKLSYNLIEDGLILIGSVKSKEEHGLLIDLGIEHVQSFLKYEKINENQTMKIGQLVRCCVIQCNISPGLCSVQLSILERDVQIAHIKKNSTLPVYCFIPGFQFEVTVKKTLIEGVEVSYKQEDVSKGFIHENYFLKKFAHPTDIEIGNKLIATLLYVKPFVNFLYFKVMPKKELKWPFRFGEIVSGKVMKVKRNGVIFKITNGSEKAKCFVPISKLKSGPKSLEEKSDILNLYPLNKKVSKIRLGYVDLMAKYYLGATDKDSVMEKYYSISDLKCGEVVSCKITHFGKSTARVEIGRSIKGVISFSDMSDVPMKNPLSKFKVGQKLKARVTEVLPEKLLVRLTMKPTLLNEKDMLCDVEKCKKNKYYTGTVFRVMDRKIIVKFVNHIFGVVPMHLTPYLDSKSLKEHFAVGQLVKCCVVDIDNEKGLLLSLSLTNAETKLEVGKKYEVKVLIKTVRGLFLEVIIDENTKCRGYLPSTLLTVHRSLISALHSTYSAGEKLMAYCIFNNIKNEAPIFGAEEIFRDIYEGKSEEEFKKSLTKYSVLPFLFRNKSLKTGHMFLRSIVPGTDDCSVIVTGNDFPNGYQLFKYQLIYGKILNVRGRKVEVSTRLCDVWDKDFNNSLNFLDSYLKSMASLVLRQKEKLDAYNQKVYVGCSVKGVIEEVKPRHAMVRTESGDLGIAEGKFKQGQEISGKIIWIDGPEQILYINTKTTDMESTAGRHSSVPVNGSARGKVVYINEEVIVLELIGRKRGELAFFPRKRHLNDTEDNECVIGMGEVLKLWITRKDSNYLLAMDRRVVHLQEKIVWKKSEERLRESVRSLKRKLESEKLERLKKRKTESEEIEVVNVKLCDKPKLSEGQEDLLPEVKEEKDDDNEAYSCAHSGIPRLEYDDVDIKSEADADEVDKQKPTCSVRNDERIILSSSSESEDEDESEKKNESAATFKVDFNWEVLNNNSLLSGVLLKGEEESSSEDEDDESKHDKKKRKRLTGIEKKEKAKSEEERLRSIEERLMDADREPESADDFDRAVLSNPNSSALWLKYMAFHIQGTEIEKARAVARRALKAISFREEQEKLNIWIALLNLENMYGNEESLRKTLSEALQVNEPYKIHLHMLGIHGQGNKLQEMERLGNFMLKKYKEMENMWCDVAGAYFAVGKVESARNVLQKALGIVQKSQHVPLISKFAQLENKYGSPERAQTLYESILASFPKRVDIWCCYVDMLIKSNHIDLARQVLERATSQSLRPRKMKTLFKKFLAFEEAHGTAEMVEKVREAAVEYVETVGAAEV